MTFMEANMSEFATTSTELQLRRIFSELEKIGIQYTEGKEYLKIIENSIQQLSNKKNRFAIIGEFKRGKSSVVNALLAADILPTDILPMTAVIHRIVYGEKKGAYIEYDDNTEENIELQNLVQYGESHKKGDAKTKRRIKEIVVSYPSTFCKKNIELLDTPGLSDEENNIISQGFSEIDVAVVVISATMPFSLTEQNIVMKLLKCTNIKSIVFVITFIDKIASDKQEIVVHFIKDRISSKFLKNLMNKHKDDRIFLDRAQKMLTQPDVYAISSIMALDGLFTNDSDKINKSGISELKQALLNISTVVQKEYLITNMVNLIEEIKGKLKEWHRNSISKDDLDIMNKEQCLIECDEYLKKSNVILENFFLDADQKLAYLGIHPVLGVDIEQFQLSLKRIFIANLSKLKINTITKTEIENALQIAQVNGLKMMEREVSGLYTAMQQVLDLAQSMYEQVRKEQFAEKMKRIPTYEDDFFINKGLPSIEFHWIEDLYQTNLNLYQDIIPQIEQIIHASCLNLRYQFNTYIMTWRKSIFSQNQKDEENFAKTKLLYDQQLQNDKKKADRKQAQCKEILKQLEMMMKDLALEVKNTNEK